VIAHVARRSDMTDVKNVDAEANDLSMYPFFKLLFQMRVIMIARTFS